MTGLQPGAATMTVLFTDLVDSTAMRSRLGDDQADEVRREHDELIARAVDENRGSIVKGLGDGIMAVFGAPSAGIAAAVAIQQSIARRNRQSRVPIALRMGLSVGEVRIESNDVYGTPVVEASRLCSAAGDDQILTAEHVKLLAGSRSTATYREFGELELKGLSEPLRTLEVQWWEASDAPTVPFPEIPTLTKPTEFIGRSVERYAIGHAWLNARTARAPVVFVSGPSGIGKTRLMAEFAQRTTQSEGGLVLYGRCTEQAGSPFQPFVEALRYYVANVPSGQLGDLLGSFSGELTRLLPELADQIPGAKRRPTIGVSGSSIDPTFARLRLFDAVAGWLVAASRDEPMVLILDELHHASPDTLDLLRHVSDSPTPMRVLILAGVCDDEIGADHAITRLQAHLRRSERGVESIRLRGLNQDDVGDLASKLVSETDVLGEARQTLGRRLHEVTAGNPLFVIEAVRDLKADGSINAGAVPVVTRPVGELDIAPTIAQTVVRRLEALDDNSIGVLQLASLVGDEFDVSIVRAIGDLGDDGFNAAVDLASASALIAESPGSRFRFAFAHTSIMSAIAATVGPGHLAAFQHRIAEELAAQVGDDSRHVGEIAIHELASVEHGGGHPDQAVTFATRAGDRASDQLAHAEAVAWYRRAADLLADHGVTPARLDLLLALGEAERRSGTGSARSTLIEVSQLAKEVDDGERMVAAALANTREFTGRPAPFDADRVELLRDARASGGGSAGERAALAALLASELVWAEDADERFSLADEALASARELGDRRVLAGVIQLRIPAIMSVDTLDERIALAQELFDLAGSFDDPVLRFHAAHLRAGAAGEAGDLEQYDHWLGVAAVVASGLDLELTTWLVTMDRASRAYLAGDLASAERHADAAFEVGDESGRAEAELFRDAVILAVRQQQGRVAEMAADVDPATSSPQTDMFLFARAVADAGRLTDAEPAYRAFAARGFPLRRQPYVGATLGNLAYLASLLGDDEGAAVLYDLLEPLAERLSPVVVFQHAGAHYLGMLAATLGRTEEAHSWFARAVEIHERVGAPLFAAETRLEWARVAFGTGDVDRARELIGQALTAGAKGRAAGIESQARTMLTAAFGGGVAAPKVAAPRPAPVPTRDEADEIAAVEPARVPSAGAAVGDAENPAVDLALQDDRADADGPDADGPAVAVDHERVQHPAAVFSDEPAPVFGLVIPPLPPVPPPPGPVPVGIAAAVAPPYADPSPPAPPPPPPSQPPLVAPPASPVAPVPAPPPMAPIPPVPPPPMAPIPPPPMAPIPPVPPPPMAAMAPQPAVSAPPPPPMSPSPMPPVPPVPPPPMAPRPPPVPDSPVPPVSVPPPPMAPMVPVPPPPVPAPPPPPVPQAPPHHSGPVAQGLGPALPPPDMAGIFAPPPSDDEAEPPAPPAPPPPA